MTDRLNYLNGKIAKHLDAAAAKLEAGFLSEAARKRALDDLRVAYDALRDIVHDEVIAAARAANPKWEEQGSGDWDGYWAFFQNREIPFTLHQLRDKHFEGLADFPRFAEARDMVALREAIRAAEVVKVERPANEEKAETVRKTIIEQLEARRANFLTGLDVSRHFGGLAVYVNAHWATHEKGTRYLRHFFYLHGRLTALNSIIAIAQTLEDEKEAAKA